MPSMQHTVPLRVVFRVVADQKLQLWSKKGHKNWNSQFQFMPQDLYITHMYFVGVGYDLVPKSHPRTAMETFGSESASDDNIEKVLHHPEFIPTVPGWQDCWVNRNSEERNFYLTVKLETKDAYHHSEEQDLFRSKPDGGNTPEVELRAAALVRPFALKTWVAQVTNVARPILVRLGTLVIPDFDELDHYTGIRLDHLADFEVGKGRKYAGTICVECHFQHALQERCGEGDNPEAAPQGTTALAETLRDHIAFPKLHSGKAPSQAHAAAVPPGPPQAPPPAQWSEATWWAQS